MLKFWRHIRPLLSADLSSLIDLRILSTTHSLICFAVCSHARMRIWDHLTTSALLLHPVLFSKFPQLINHFLLLDCKLFSHHFYLILHQLLLLPLLVKLGLFLLNLDQLGLSKLLCLLRLPLQGILFYFSFFFENQLSLFDVHFLPFLQFFHTFLFL